MMIPRRKSTVSFFVRFLSVSKVSGEFFLRRFELMIPTSQLMILFSSYSKLCQKLKYSPIQHSIKELLVIIQSHSFAVSKCAICRTLPEIGINYTAFRRCKFEYGFRKSEDSKLLLTYDNIFLEVRFGKS